MRDVLSIVVSVMFFGGMTLGAYLGFEAAWRLANGQSGLSWWIVFIAVWSFVTPIVSGIVFWAIAGPMLLISARYESKEQGVSGPQP